jgi:nicotinate (nicotinamide) nucleotide adenylyltransferase
LAEQSGHSVYDGGHSLPHVGHIQVNMATSINLAMMTFFVRARVQPRRLGVFPGTYNPPSRAHLALAKAALLETDEVVFVIPQTFPHKSFEGASFDQRVAMLSKLAEADPRFSVAAAAGGLFVEIARELRSEYDPCPALRFLCGRDAAERIVNWNYGDSGAVPNMLEQFELLVAGREGAYHPPPEIAHRIHSLPVEEDYGSVSATEVRRRIRQGLAWEHLVPESITTQVREVYS